MNMLRQGDVLFIKVKEAPASEAAAIEREAGRIVVAKGEVTGHAHTITTPDVVMYEHQSIRWLVAPHEFVLEHQEHSPLTIAPGIWRVAYQREYDPQAIRRVMD